MSDDVGQVSAAGSEEPLEPIPAPGFSRVVVPSKDTPGWFDILEREWGETDWHIVAATNSRPYGPFA